MLEKNVKRTHEKTIKEIAYEESLISENIIDVLSQIISKLNKSHQGKCLNIFCSLALYKNGLEYVKRNPQVMYRFYDMIDAENPTVSNAIISIFIEKMKADNDFTAMISIAA